MQTLLQDLRYSVRMLMNKPGFTAMAVLTLALGIGATTAIFSVVYTTLFESLPYPKPEQLVMVWSQANQGRSPVSAGDYLEWKRRSTSFQYLEAWSGATFNVATAERPEQIQAALMTPGFFRMTGTPMWLGRDFLPEEGEVGKDHVVIMTHRMWSQYFGADQEIIGQQIRMNGEPYTVIGVAPRAARIATSRWRVGPRASSRLAMLTQPMSSIMATAPNSVRRSGRTFPVRKLFSGTSCMEKRVSGR